jgi:hypothetical protein
MVVASARTTAAEIAARWCARRVTGGLLSNLGGLVCVYERGHRQDRLEPLAPCGPPRTDCNPLLKGTHTSHGPMASLL